MIYVKDYRHVAVVENPTPEIDDLLHKQLRVKAEKPFFSPAYKSGRWDGFYTHYQKRSHAFAAGLLPKLVEKGLVQVEEMRKCPKITKDLTCGGRVEPRGYQLEAATVALEAGRGIIQIPTGGGKTVVMAMMAHAIKGRVLVIVPTKALLMQTVKELKKFLKEPIGVIGAGEFVERRVTVGIINSVKMAEKEFFQTWDAVFVDEAQRAAAKGYQDTLLACPAYLRFGFSADALDSEGVKAEKGQTRQQIIGALGPIVYKVSMGSLKDAGHVAEPIIKLVKVDDRNGEDDAYAEAYCRAHCTNDRLQDAIGQIVENHPNEATLILVRHIAHGDALHNAISGSKWVHGNTDIKEIAAAVADFRNGDFNVLIASDIFREGIDIPEIDVLVMASGDVAPTKQRLGRGLRKKAVGKSNSVFVYDFQIGENKHINRHLKKRIKVYLAEKHKINV